jgi:hypothetical protein
VEAAVDRADAVLSGDDFLIGLGALPATGRPHLAALVAASEPAMAFERELTRV